MKGDEIPSTPTAKLMFYLDCICQVFDLNQNNEIRKYRDYKNHFQMTKDDQNTIISLCMLFNPKDLVGKVFFSFR